MSKAKSTLIDKALKSKLSAFEGKQKELAKAQKGLADDVVNTLKDIIQSSNYIEAARWQQYTPGFNDGDPCEFSVRELQVKFSDSLIEEYGNEEKSKSTKADDEPEDSDNEDGFIDEYELDSFVKDNMDVLNHKDMAILEDQILALNRLHGTLESMEGELERKFGNNIQITLTKKGIETEDYDCGY